jgi:hypothetical protein
VQLQLSPLGMHPDSVMQQEVTRRLNARVWEIAREADADVRTVRREIGAPGSVRGRVGERVRRAIERRLTGGSPEQGAPDATA